MDESKDYASLGSICCGWQHKKRLKLHIFLCVKCSWMYVYQQVGVAPSRRQIARRMRHLSNLLIDTEVNQSKSRKMFRERTKVTKVNWLNPSSSEPLAPVLHPTSLLFYNILSSFSFLCCLCFQLHQIKVSCEWWVARGAQCWVECFLGRAEWGRLR